MVRPSIGLRGPMKTKILLFCGVTLVGGCAGVYDQSAVPVAGQAKALAYEQCSAQKKADAQETNSQLTECILAADLAFARTIKLKNMDLYTTYGARLRLVSAQRDQGTITRDELVSRVDGIQKDYYGRIDQAAAIDAEQRARMAAAMSAMGESMQREADRQAYIQAHNPTVNCTSTTFGSQVNTTCH